MRILHIIPSLQVGGAERIAAILATDAAARGLSAAIVSLGVSYAKPNLEFEGAFRRRLGAANVLLFECGSAGHPSMWRALTSTVGLKRALRSFKPNVVFTHTEWAEAALALTSLRARKVIRVIHNTLLWDRHPMARRLVASRLSDATCVCVSSDVRTAVAEVYGHEFAASNVITIENGVLVPGAGEPRSPQSLHRPLRLLYFARLEPQKGLDLLLASLRSLPASLSGLATLDVYGDGSLRDLVVAASGDRGVVPVRYKGVAPGANDIMPHYDICLMPSRFEGLPLQLIEAVSNGLYPLISDAPGLRQIMPADWPFVFRTGSQEGLSNCLEALIHRALVADLPDLRQLQRDFAARFCQARMTNAYMQECEKIGAS